MPQIVKKRVQHCEVDYYFEFKDQKDNTYYSFPCSEDGVVRFGEMSEIATKNYWKCINKELDVKFVGIRANRRVWSEPAVLKCDCETHIELADFTNTCEKCGADYNFAGQRLAPREQWGEETGEHWTECY